MQRGIRVLEEEAVVVSVGDGVAEVITETKSTCGSCAAKSGCGTSLLASMFPQRNRTFRASNSVGAQTGDRVIIGLDESALQIAALLVYLAPLAGLIGGAILGAQLAPAWGFPNTELTSIFLGVAGFVLVLYLVRRFSPRLAGRIRYQARILRILGPAGLFHPEIKLTEIPFNEK